MLELSEAEMQAINGGAALAYLIYTILGICAYKLWRARRGRVGVSKLISIEWSD